jgi:hypothetical protein
MYAAVIPPLRDRHRMQYNEVDGFFAGSSLLIFQLTKVKVDFYFLMGFSVSFRKWRQGV